MSARREAAAFALVLGTLIAGAFADTLFGGKVLSPADVLFVSASFRDVKGPDYEPENRLLTDPVLQFQPWLEFNRAMLRRGRLPLWNDLAGCGAPHLANGQSGVFDPFHLIAYLGTLPDALAWMASARLWVAGLGMFLLARSWGLGAWGRWFAGLVFPFSGFLVVWLLYPVTSVAVWMPWVFLATDGVLERPGLRRAGALSLAVGLAFLGGHVQTSAHVLLAAGLYAAWRAVSAARHDGGEGSVVRPVAAWALAVANGLAVAAVVVVPLWSYLGKSPVWADRENERPSPWRVGPVRGLDAVCTAVPYAFGSQRRGHPNLARAVGVHNLNESAGGFAGLATLIWLAPHAWATRGRRSRVPFLAGLTAAGFLAAFEVPPVVNLVRALPLLNVTDHRRLTLWVAFGLSTLGGVGLDRLSAPWSPRANRWWLSVCAAGVGALALGALAVSQSESWLRPRAEGHYARAAVATEGADVATYRRRADRQVRQALDHVPRQLLITAAELAALGALAAMARNGRVPWSLARPAVLALTVAEVVAFGYGLNPAIARADERAVPEVLARLRREVGRSGRVVGVGEELPPNVAMRYGLADARNYDSVELSRNVDWFEPLYEPDPRARSSRRTVTWSGVLRARDRLREGGVVAVVAASPPPAGLACDARRVGAVWLVRLDAPRLAPEGAVVDDGRIQVSTDFHETTGLVVRQTFDPGWRAEVDGRPAAVSAHRGAFLSVRVGPGRHAVMLRYDPPEVRAACAVSLGGLGVAVFALTGFRPIRSTRFPRLGLGPLRDPRLESV